MPAHAHVSGSLAALGSVKEYEVPVADTSLPLAVTVIREATTLVRHEASLISPSGVVLENGSTTGRQLVLAVAPGSEGTYKLRIRAVVGSGGFDADLSGGLGAAPADPEPDSGDGDPDPTGDDGDGSGGGAQVLDLAGVVRSSARVARRALAARTARKLRRSGGFRFAAQAPAAGSYQVIVRSGTMTVAKGRRAFAGEGKGDVRVKLTKGGKKLLRFSRRAKFAVHVSFTTADGANASAKAVTRPRQAAARSRR
jgi:hypothetical protein